jgi:hypothetical protein
VGATSLPPEELAAILSRVARMRDCCSLTCRGVVNDAAGLVLEHSVSLYGTAFQFDYKRTHFGDFLQQVVLRVQRRCWFGLREARE